MWILIVFAYSGSNGVAITTAEFNGESNCQTAVQQVRSLGTSFGAICVKRGQ